MRPSSFCSLAKDLFIAPATLFIYIILKKSCLYLSANQIIFKQNKILNLKTGKTREKNVKCLESKKDLQHTLMYSPTLKGREYTGTHKSGRKLSDK